MIRALVVALLVCALPAFAQSVPSGGGGGASVTSGSVVIRTSGACDTGYTDVTSTFGGRFIAGMPTGGTIAGTLGTAFTNLADASVTPAGTNATSTVTPLGSVGAHTHDYGTQSATNYTGAMSYIRIDGGALTGTWSAGTNAGAQTVTVLSGTATNSATPSFTGSASTVAAQTFTGTANTTMRSTIAPLIQVRFCSKD